ncbi:MAG TPA: type II secretion system F family protein [Gammaproteobacteria bacterium]|nr:type II secretion system F family protein [Gammaproteobacteria bacterium]
MAKFVYQARNQAGASIQGVIEAATPQNAANQLLQNGVIPLHIDVQKQDMSLWRQLRRQLGIEKPGLDDLILFCRQCYSLNKAGVPIIRGFHLLAESNRNPAFAEVIKDVANDLEGGRELSAAMARHPKVFSPLFINMIRVGESSGRVDEAFLNLHQYYERDKETSRQIKAALRYPSFVLIAIVIAVVILMMFVIPKFTQFYAKNGLTLPLPTRIIMSISNFMADYWFLILGGAAVGIYSFIRYINTEAGRLWWDEMKTRFWAVGGIVQRGVLARFARTLALALKAGVPVLQAINVTARAVGNEYMSTKIISMRENIERGESMLRAAAKQEVFTPIVLQMIAVGEETGRIDEMLEEVAGFYEREVDYDVKNINSLIEPLLTVGMAGLVLLLMLAVFLPMWNVVDMIKH